MRYAFIDTDGQLHMRDGDPLAHFKAHGHAQVRLTRALPIRGWVSDCGLILPDVYARNPVGAAMLCTLGAGIQPYAGPVVITGWDDYKEVVPLRGDEVLYLPILCRDVRIAIGLDPGEVIAPDGRDMTEWAEQVREIAEIARNGEAPPMRFFGGFAWEAL